VLLCEPIELLEAVPAEGVCDSGVAVELLLVLLPDWPVDPACELIEDWSGVLDAEADVLGVAVAEPLTPPVVEVPALDPIEDCEPVTAWSGGVVLELEEDGVVLDGGVEDGIELDGVPVLEAAPLWLDGEVALLCELMLD
jgi:hypothetical protein